MKFSIITVCYNSERTISKTLESVLNQTYNDYEYIIIDGMSKDNTLEIIKKYEKKFEGKMRFISEKDNGIYDAMNKGISYAKGELIGMINSDDWYEPNALEIMAENYSRKKYEILYGMQREWQDEKEVVCWLKNHIFLEKHMITHPTCFVTKSIYEDFGMYDLQYKSSADYDFMLRMYKKDEVTFKPVYQVISNFALGGMSGRNIGRIETARIKYKYNIISLYERNKIILVNYIKIFLKKIIKRV